MGRLNAKRTIPYDFHVVEFDHEAVLIDASEHIYPCSTRPHFDFESLYELIPSEGDVCWRDGCEGVIEEDEWEDPFCPVCEGDYDGLSKLSPGMLLVSAMDMSKAIKVEMDDEDVAPDVPREEAWEMARDDAQSNHYL
jgi:hypothetical protein